MNPKFLTAILLLVSIFSANAKGYAAIATPPSPCTKTEAHSPSTSAPKTETQANVFNAISKGVDAAELKLTIDKKYINTPNQLGITPLIFSAVKGNWSAATTLISLGAEINLKTDAGTALLAAIAGNQYEFAYKLIERGAKLPTTCEDQYTMLRTAFIIEKAQYMDAAVFIAYLLSNGFDVNNMDDNQYTPIMAAAALNSESIVNVLLAHGANPSLKSNSGKNAFDIAKEKKNKKILHLLTRKNKSTKVGSQN